MKTFVIAVTLLLAIALTAVLTAGATVVALRQWPDWLPSRVDPDPPVLRSTGEERRGGAERVGETLRPPREDAEVDADRLLVAAPQRTQPSDDASRLTSVDEAVERDEPTAVLVALERSIPSETEDRPAASGSRPSLPPEGEPAREAKTPDEPTPFGSIDYLKLSTDLQHVSETLERFNNKLLRMIATAESDSERTDVATAPK